MLGEEGMRMTEDDAKYTLLNTFRSYKCRNKIFSIIHIVVAIALAIYLFVPILGVSYNVIVLGVISIIGAVTSIIDLWFGVRDLPRQEFDEIKREYEMITAKKEEYESILVAKYGEEAESVQPIISELYENADKKDGNVSIEDIRKVCLKYGIPEKAETVLHILSPDPDILEIIKSDENDEEGETIEFLKEIEMRFDDQIKNDRRVILYMVSGTILLSLISWLLLGGKLNQAQEAAAWGGNVGTILGLSTMLLLKAIGDLGKQRISNMAVDFMRTMEDELSDALSDDEGVNHIIGGDAALLDKEEQ